MSEKRLKATDDELEIFREILNSVIWNVKIKDLNYTDGITRETITVAQHAQNLIDALDNIYTFGNVAKYLSDYVSDFKDDIKIDEEGQADFVEKAREIAKLKILFLQKIYKK